QHIDREGQDNAHVELVLGWLLRDESNCIDVGANEGRFLAHIVNRAKHGTHLAWEPLPEFAERARREFPTVEVHQAALSDHAGLAEFVYVPELPAYSSLRERSYPSEVHPERIQVQLERLDDSLPEGYVPHFIKIDVEGAEREVIEGGLETIARHRPIVVFEHGLGAADRYGTTPEHIWDLLAGTAKLHIFDMDAVGPLSRDHFSEIFASGERWNYIALP
ncbi:MAG TPA: FkbM family methyltransferase, partial [Jatrophihabitans sp.]